jgi:hypothetical protein
MKIETKTLREAFRVNVHLNPARPMAIAAGAVASLLVHRNNRVEDVWLTREECLTLGTALLGYAMGFTPEDET